MRTHQFFARLFCLACRGDDLEWARASGFGTVYSMTTVHRQVSADFPAPYVNALVTLTRGLAVETLVGPPCAIGARVRVTWKDRVSSPPLPMFTPTGEMD